MYLLTIWISSLEKCLFRPFALFFFFFFLIFGCVGSSLLHVGFSLVAASGGHPPLRCAGLLIAVASLVVEHGLQAHGLQ